MKLSTIAWATCIGLGLSSALSAQTGGIPREFPPADFTGNQYVDSDGCAFIRAGISGNVSWVPRVDRQRRQLCNFQPTFAAEPEPQEETAPVAPSVVAEAPAPVVAPVPVAAAPEPMAAAPEPSVAPVITAPLVAPVVAPVIAEPEPLAEPVTSITRAEACEGRSGIQPGLVSARTGQPIDCGPSRAPVVAAAPVLMPEADPVPRMTMAEICAETARTGTRFINQATGEPVDCPAPVAPLAAMAPVAPVSDASEPEITTMQTRYVTTCGGVAIHTSVGSNVSVRCGSGGASSEARADVPSSNPPAGTPVTRAAPAGYEQTWNDGRLNPDRGLPATATRVSTRSTATAAQSPASAAYRYVQVGSFADHANADRLGARMMGMGLPVSMARRGALKIVLAGPFTETAAAREALSTAKTMGFADAYLRN